jgi:hypothetical protein
MISVGAASAGLRTLGQSEVHGPAASTVAGWRREVVVRTLLWVSGLMIVAVVSAVAPVEEGEVVTLVARDAHGRERGQRLWVVDLNGAVWVRALSPYSDWVERLRSQPVARLNRAGQVSTVRGLPDESPGAREAVEHAMELKYGALARFVGWLHAPDAAVPVRLVPQASAAPVRLAPQASAAR